MTMHKALYVGDNIDRSLYLSRKEGRRMVSIEECIDASKEGLKEYTEMDKDKLLQPVTVMSEKKDKQENDKI